MNKKVITVVAIIAVVAVVLIVAVAVKNDAPAGETQKQTTTSQQPSKTTAQPTGDAEIDALEKDINSISDEDFGDASLSDTAVGL